MITTCKLEAGDGSVSALSRAFGGAGVAVELVDHFANHGRPARLMTGTNTTAVIAVEILVKQEQIAPVGIVLEEINVSIERPPTIRTPPEQIHKAMLKEE
jgi:hypothetical protein